MPETLQLPDDRSIAPVQHDGDVAAAGLIAEGRVLRIGGALTVGGAIEAVQLSTGGPVTVAGGIVGKQKGRYTVGGDLHCRFITGGSLMVRGDARVDSEVVNSRLTCTGRLDVAGGVVVGGDIAANGGVTCRTLGHANGAITLVEAGDGRALRLLTETVTAQIDANRKRVATVRSTIEPLLKHMKQLSPQQREKATELLYEAGEIDAATANMVEGFEQRKRLIRSRAKPEIAVAGVVYGGVIVRFGGVEAVVGAPMKGPLTLTCRKDGAVSEIVALDAADGSSCVLPSRAVEAPAAAA